MLATFISRISRSRRLGSASRNSTLSLVMYPSSQQSQHSYISRRSEWCCGKPWAPQPSKKSLRKTLPLPSGSSARNISTGEPKVTLTHCWNLSTTSALCGSTTASDRLLLSSPVKRLRTLPVKFIRLAAHLKVAASTTKVPAGSSSVLQPRKKLPCPAVVNSSERSSWVCVLDAANSIVVDLV